MKSNLPLILVTLLISPFASADYKFTVGGNVCQSVYDESSTLGQSIFYDRGGIRKARNSGYAYVTCPIVKPAHTGSRITDLDVSVNDPSGSMWCSASVSNRYYESGISERAEVSGSGNRMIDFGSVGSNPSYEGLVSLFCVLPEGASIHSIAYDVAD